MNEQLKAEIMKAETFQQMLDACGKYYDFKNARPGQIAKSLFINQFPMVVATMGAKQKK